MNAAILILFGHLLIAKNLNSYRLPTITYELHLKASKDHSCLIINSRQNLHPDSQGDALSASLAKNYASLDLYIHDNAYDQAF